jgi:protein-S-isoprenylcysteine O-methyltransferase Ste14
MTSINDMLQEMMDRPVQRRKAKAFLTVATGFCGMMTWVVCVLAVVAPAIPTWLPWVGLVFSSLALCFIVWFMAIDIQDE